MLAYPHGNSYIGKPGVLAKMFELVTPVTLGFLFFGCSAADTLASPGGGDPTGTGGTVILDLAEIVFEPEETLTLEPGEQAELTVRVTPAEGQTVKFDLLSDQAAFDGFLFEATSRVDGKGETTVRLQAPSAPATFQVRASMGPNEQALKSISVDSTGHAEVTLLPEYSGKRQIEEWTATAWIGVTCDEIEGIWKNGSITASSPKEPVLKDVPADSVVAIVLRGDELVSGCVMVTDLDRDEQRLLKVTVTDRTLDFSDGTLELFFGMEETTVDFANHLIASIDQGVRTWKEAEPSEALLLLNAMREGLEGEQASTFASLTTEKQLAQSVETLWGTPTPLSTKVTTLLVGKAESIPGASTFIGILNLDPKATGFALTAAGGVEASRAGFTASDWTVTRESGDLLNIGGNLTYSPFAWLLSMAETGDQGADFLAKTLATTAQCTSVAQVLSDALGTDSPLYCVESCLEELCNDGAARLVLAFDRTLSPTTLQLSARATIGLSASGEVSEVTGSWIGRLGMPSSEPTPSEPPQDSESSVRGPLLGTPVEAGSR